MQLYTAKDIELAKEKLGDIVEGIDKKKLDIFEPTKKEILSASQIVLDFVKENKEKYMVEQHKMPSSHIKIKMTLSMEKMFYPILIFTLLIPLEI